MKMIRCQSITVAHKYLEGLGVERDFFEVPDQPNAAPQLQPVLVLTSMERSSARAVVVLYIMSHEIGLWVRPDLRSRGLGTQMMKTALADKTFGADYRPIYARTSTRLMSFGPAMRRILERHGFRRVATGSWLDLWVLSREKRPHIFCQNC